MVLLGLGYNLPLLSFFSLGLGFCSKFARQIRYLNPNTSIGIINKSKTYSGIKLILTIENFCILVKKLSNFDAKFLEQSFNMSLQSSK